MTARTSPFSLGNVPWVLVLAACTLCGCACNPVPSATNAGSGDAADLRPGPDLPGPDGPAGDLEALRPDGGSTRGVGCSADEDCSVGLHCETDQPDGLCTRACTENADCGAVGACHDGRCHLRCNVRAIFNPCRDKYVCRLDVDHGVCVADCNHKSCSQDGWTCDAGSGLCLDPNSGGLAAPCGVDVGGCDNTPNGHCVKLVTFGDGFCTIPCSPFTKPCPLEIEGALCTLPPHVAPFCAFTCDPDAPSCPDAEMKCVDAGGGLYVCLHT
jgi:hypothetical protein